MPMDSLAQDLRFGLRSLRRAPALSAIIVLTLGLGLVLVNAIILYLLDFLSENLMIETIPALLWGAVIIGFLNFIVHAAEK